MFAIFQSPFCFSVCAEVLHLRDRNVVVYLSIVLHFIECYGQILILNKQNKLHLTEVLYK